MKLGTKTGKSVIEFLELEWQDGWLGIELKPIKPKQTDEQRGFYWRSLHAWGRELGYTRKEAELVVHLAVCCEAYGAKKNAVLFGNTYTLPKETSSKQNRENYSLLIETLIMMAAEYGFVIEDPKRVA